MKKPHLEILSDADDPVLKGRCSSCDGATFSLRRNTESALALIHGMFSEHFRKVHMPEGAGQAPARIVKEATEQD
jgi:hypothetical protein